MYMTKHIRMLEVFGINQLKIPFELPANLFHHWDGHAIALVIQRNQNLISMLLWPIHHRTLVLLLSMKHLKTSSGKFKSRILKTLDSKLKVMILYSHKYELARNILLKQQGYFVFVQRKLLIAKGKLAQWLSQLKLKSATTGVK